MAYNYKYPLVVEGGILIIHLNNRWIFIKPLTH